MFEVETPNIRRKKLWIDKMGETEMETYKPSRETWDIIHKLGADATTDEKIDRFIIVIHDIIDFLPCEECRDHAIEFLASHHPDQYRHIVNASGTKVGMFVWSVDLHNNANRIVKTSRVDWVTVYPKYKLRLNPPLIRKVPIPVPKFPVPKFPVPKISDKKISMTAVPIAERKTLPHNRSNVVTVIPKSNVTGSRPPTINRVRQPITNKKIIQSQPPANIPTSQKPPTNMIIKSQQPTSIPSSKKPPTNMIIKSQQPAVITPLKKPNIVLSKQSGTACNVKARGVPNKTIKFPAKPGCPCQIHH
jgi:hypothetical protein